VNILQVTLGFYPAVAWGGPVKIVHQNARELLRRGHEVTVYCTNLLDKSRKLGPSTSERKVDGIRVVYFNTWHFSHGRATWPGTLGPVWLPDLPGYLRGEISVFDVIHVNGYRNLMNLPVARGARQAQVPLVMQPHGTMPVIVNSFLVKRLYDRLLGGQELQGLSALIALQESERQQAIARGVPPERIEIIPNGLDLSAMAEIPEAGSFRRWFGIPADRPLLLFLGRINRKKGTDMLVEAFHRLGGLDAYLAIVGPDDGQLEEVRRLIVRYRLEDRVLLTGLLAGGKVVAAYRDADLFVLPCRADTFPTTIMEACLAGTPMVITDRCEIAHLIGGRVGDVVPFDADALSDAIKQLLTDKSRYRRYHENCPMVMRETFSVEATVDRLEEVYERVVRERMATAR
jgi:glycosyltransferase involved in cell wall biosynthesis